MKERPARRRPDRLLDPHAKPDDHAIDKAIAPFDRAVAEANKTWGIDRLEELVPTDVAARYGRAVAALNAAIEKADLAAVEALAGNCVRGLEAMHKMAEAAGMPKADPGAIEYDLDGWHFAVLRDERAWPAFRDMRPNVPHFTMREVGLALKAYRLDNPHMAKLKEAIPEAKVVSIRTKGPVDWEAGGDSLEGLF